MKEISPEQRALLAFVLSIVVLLVWGKFYKPPAPPPGPAPAQHVQRPVEGASKAAAPGTKGSEVAAPAPAGMIAAAEEKTIVVESDLYRVELSNRGGVVRSWQLKIYTDDQKPPHPLDLVNARTAQQLGGWPFSLALEDAQLEAQVNSALFQVTPAAGPIRSPAEVTFEWSDGHLAVIKRLKFAPDYKVDVESSVQLDGRALPQALAWRGGFGDTAVYHAAQQVNVFYQAGGKINLLPYKKLGAAGQPSQRLLQAGPLDFAGIEDQFFTAAFLPGGPDLELWHWAEETPTVEDGKPAKESVAEMAAGTTAAAPLSLRAYVGPKDLAILGKQQPPLDGLVQFGWFGLIARPLFEILKWIYRFVPNYGWAIVLLTIAINTALFPLKVKSWRSMQRMQKVAPEVESLKQKYAKYSMTDPRKREMNEKMMEIYKREGVNPIGGCLPTLLQFPIWFALYRMLGGAIELRHAKWIGWIHDLSARDPYYILPVLMVITMYFMQKMTPMTTADPAQQKMMAMMPIMMGGMFIIFPVSSGLVLYIVTSSLVGMGQQWYLNKTAPLPPKGKGGGKKR